MHNVKACLCFVKQYVSLLHCHVEMSWTCCICVLLCVLHCLCVFVFCLCFCLPGAWNFNVLPVPPLPFSITLCCHSFRSLYLSEISLYTWSVNPTPHMIIFYREFEAGVLHDCVLFSFNKAAHVCTGCMSSSVVRWDQGMVYRWTVWLVKPCGCDSNITEVQYRDWYKWIH